jgi:two-component system response regulator
MDNKKIDILLVEDNEYEARLALLSLKKHSLAGNLLHIKDGEYAADFIFGTGQYHGRNISNRPGVILLDINLPKLNGLEILRMIKSDERTKTIPVVLLTSSRESRDVEEGYALGANSYIVKPVEYESFNNTMKQLGLYWTVLNQLPRAVMSDQAVGLS